MLVPLWVVWRTKSSIGGGGSASAGQARTSPPARTRVWSFGIAFFSPAPWRKNRNERVEFIQSPGDADDPGPVDAGVPANLQIGRRTCRERVCPSGYIPGAAVSYTKKKKR